jgi:hypothetical protein
MYKARPRPPNPLVPTRPSLLHPLAARPTVRAGLRNVRTTRRPSSKRGIGEVRTSTFAKRYPSRHPSSLTRAHRDPRIVVYRSGASAIPPPATVRNLSIHGFVLAHTTRPIASSNRLNKFCHLETRRLNRRAEHDIEPRGCGPFNFPQWTSSRRPESEDGPPRGCRSRVYNCSVTAWTIPVVDPPTKSKCVEVLRHRAYRGREHDACHGGRPPQDITVGSVAELECTGARPNKRPIRRTVVKSSRT